jgi:hypothetical protein
MVMKKLENHFLYTLESQLWAIRKSFFIYPRISVMGHWLYEDLHFHFEWPKIEASICVKLTPKFF